MVFRRRRYVKRKIVRRRRVASKPKVKFVKKLVRQVLSRNLETKIREYATSSNLVPYAVSALYTNTIFPLSPYSSSLQIDQGTGQSARIGNTIRTKQLLFRGICNPTGYHATLNPYPRPIIVKLVICTSRDNRTAVDTSIANFFQNGSSSQAPSGNTFDMIRSFNKDGWIIHKVIQFKLGCANSNGTGGNATEQYFGNNDFKYSHQFTLNLTKYMSKIVKFDDNTSQPTIPILQCIPLVTACNGTPYGSSEVPAVMNYNLTYTYTDA